MKNRILTILIIIIALAIIPITVFAKYDGVDTNVTIGDSPPVIQSSVTITKNIVGKLQVIGSIVSVVALMIIGIRYMTSGVEKKAELKGIMRYYVTGCILVFATSNILGIVYSVIEDINEVHKWKTQRVEATCTADGYVYTWCDGHCDSKSTQILYATGHDWKVVSTTSATCEQDAIETRKCKRKSCNATENVSIEEKLGHDWNVLSTIQATCIQAGSKTQECLRCGKTGTETIIAPGHDWGEVKKTPPTCTKAGSETRQCLRTGCGQKDISEINPLKHDWGSWSTTQKATCEKDGTKKRTCKRTGCSQSETKPITKLSHRWPKEPSSEELPTCTKKRKKNL